ncbi:uncharacterized protein [Magallana gigas]|uniref:uncharacterized protein isoform X4 n=1 Tax=Magallana gigas TaxID=29159 RepID=UPI0033410190
MFRGGSKQDVCCFRLKMGGFLHLWTRCGRTLLPVYVYLLVGSRIYCKGDGCLSFPVPMNIYFNESSASGSVIFVSSETNSQTKEWFVTSIEPRVALTFVKQTYQLVLLSEVDLDVPNPSDTCFPPQLQFMQRITCFRHFLDPKDASEYFTVNSTTGYLYQTKQFDYEESTIQCGIGKEGGFLNITAEDGLHKTFISLSVAFINIDDAPPVFVNSDCSNVCLKCPLSSLSTFVHITHQGLIPTNPPAIKAIYLGSNVVYDMDVYPTKYSDNIRFENGTFVLPQSFANFSGYAEESDFTVTVIMQATGSNGQTSDKFPFSIHVNTRPISSTSQQITDQTSSCPTKYITVIRQSTNDVIIIVLVVVVVLLLTIIIVNVVYRYRFHKTKSVSIEPVYSELQRNSIEIEHIYTIA